MDNIESDVRVRHFRAAKLKVQIYLFTLAQLLLGDAHLRVEITLTAELDLSGHAFG